MAPATEEVWTYKYREGSDRIAVEYSAANAVTRDRHLVKTEASGRS
jgi:hypothetical protein